MERKYHMSLHGIIGNINETNHSFEASESITRLDLLYDHLKYMRRSMRPNPVCHSDTISRPSVAPGLCTTGTSGPFSPQTAQGRDQDVGMCSSRSTSCSTTKTFLHRLANCSLPQGSLSSQQSFALCACRVYLNLTAAMAAEAAEDLLISACFDSYHGPVNCDLFLHRPAIPYTIIRPSISFFSACANTPRFSDSIYSCYIFCCHGEHLKIQRRSAARGAVAADSYQCRGLAVYLLLRL